MINLFWNIIATLYYLIYNYMIDIIGKFARSLPIVKLFASKICTHPLESSCALASTGNPKIYGTCVCLYIYIFIDINVYIYIFNVYI